MNILNTESVTSVQVDLPSCQVGDPGWVRPDNTAVNSGAHSDDVSSSPAAKSRTHDTPPLRYQQNTECFSTLAV